MKREQTATAILKAMQAWEKAPVHVRAMAGAYVLPLLAALVAMNEEIDELKNDLIKGVM